MDEYDSPSPDNTVKLGLIAFGLMLFLVAVVAIPAIVFTARPTSSIALPTAAPPAAAPAKQGGNSVQADRKRIIDIANMLIGSESVMQLHVLKKHEKEIEEILKRHPKWRDSSAIAGFSVPNVNLND